MATYASLSAEVRIEDRLRDLNASAIFLAVLSGITPSKLNLALRGMRPLSNEDAKALLDLTQRLVELRDALQPIPLSLLNPGSIQNLLDQIEKYEVTPEQIRAMVQTLFSGKESK